MVDQTMSEKYGGAWIHVGGGTLKWDKHQKVQHKLDLSKISQSQEKKVEEVSKPVEAPKAKKKSSLDGVTIEFVAMPDKCPRQMRHILTKLSEFGKGGVPISMLIDKLEGQLPTKQSVERVYKHYHREMVDKEYIRILN